MGNQILLVDDDVELLDAFKDSLEIRGYDVITAINGMDAFEMFQKNQPCITFMDIKMPKMDGYTSFSKIKGMYNDAKVVFVSGQQNIEKSEIAKNNGIIEIFEKPVSSEKIVKTIQENGC